MTEKRVQPYPVYVEDMLDVYSIDIDGPLWANRRAVLSDEEIEDYKRVTAEFEAWQDRLSAAW